MCRSPPLRHRLLRNRLLPQMTILLAVSERSARPLSVWPPSVLPQGVRPFPARRVPDLRANLLCHRHRPDHLPAVLLRLLV